MMDQVKDMIENYLVKLYLPFKKISLPYDLPEGTTWIIDDYEQKLENIIINYNNNVITLRLSVCDIPKSNRLRFYEQVLEMNNRIIYGGYGIIEDKLIISHSSPLEGLTFDKFASIYNAFTFSLLQDLKEISKLTS